MTKNKKTKIIYLVTKAGIGGAQKYVYDLATSLPRDKFDVLVVVGEGNSLDKRLAKAKIRVEKIKEMGRDVNIFLESIILFRLLKIFFNERPDVVHVNSSKAGGLGAFAARILLVPKIIFTVHGWPFNEPRFDNKITRFFSWLTVFFSTKTIVISRQNLEQTRRWPLTKNKFQLIYNGIMNFDFRDRESSRNFIAEITHADKNKIWLVTISELHQNKGLKYLIEAIGILDEKPIVFVIGEGEERDNLELLIKSLDLDKYIFLMGSIEDAGSYLKAFDIFTLTSIKEGLPYTILEAGLARLPVIGSNIPGITDILDNENGILVKARSSKDIAESIKSLSQNQGKMAQLGSSLGATIERKFLFDKMLRKTLKLY